MTQKAVSYMLQGCYRLLGFPACKLLDLAATCNQLAVMKKGHFLYSGSIQNLLDHAAGYVWEESCFIFFFLCSVRPVFSR